eukprot:s1123_g4.t1
MAEVAEETMPENEDLDLDADLDAARPEGLPFDPPEEVQQLLRPQDWDALAQAWEAAEARTAAWQTLGEGLGPGSWQDSDGERFVEAGSPTPVKKKKSRPKWKEDWSLIGSDSRRPAPLRRYFDSVPAEIRPPVEPVRPDMRRVEPNPRFVEDDRFEALLYGTGWLDCWGQIGSTDNDALHPHLRHMFDKRGIESSYRQRPTADHPWLQTLPPRTPQRPSPRTLKQRIICRATAQKPPPDPSEPAKSIPWGVRCLRYGADFQAHRSMPRDEKIPWVYDHNRSESEDNTVMNPILRHYFDQDGIESSFRNRGRQFGRPVKSVFGREFSKPKFVSLASLSTAASSTSLQASQSQPSLRSPQVSRPGAARIHDKR